MATEIKYKDLFGSEISFQQVQQLNDDYQQEEYLDGVLKRTDYYEDNVINNGEYYLSEDEDLSTILSDMQAIWKYGYFYLDTATVSVYTVKNWEIYVGLIKTSKGKTVYDSQGREIAIQSYNISTLDTIKTEKKYYLESVGQFIDSGDVLGFGTIYFDYDYPNAAPTDIFVDVKLPGFDHKSYFINDQKNILLHPLIAEVFSWNDQTYYHSDTPLIPGK